MCHNMLVCALMFVSVRLPVSNPGNGQAAEFKSCQTLNFSTFGDTKSCFPLSDPQITMEFDIYQSKEDTV